MTHIRPLIATLASALLISAALAADTPDAPKEVTLKGTLMCAKCELHLTDKCQNVLKVTDGDKSTLYYLLQNDLSKSKHPDVCHAPKDNVSVTGTLETKDGKNEITPTKIDIPAN
ncbi:MAG TPA: DUF6370 family protein [Phycisphaerae bacterium]|nr:DUF6370 family protein [Phycisphaerae bacterium]